MANMKVLKKRKYNKEESADNRIKSKRYFYLLKKLRFFRFFGALLGCIAIIPALVSYELSYSADRTMGKCDIVDNHTYFYRFICLGLSLLGICFELSYKKVYYESLKLYPFTFEELPPEKEITFLDVVEKIRNRSWTEFFVERGTWLVIVLFVVFPYPGVNIEIVMTRQMLYKKVEICYYLEEIFLVFMFGRIFYLFITVLSLGHISHPHSLRMCERYSVKLSARFSLRAYISLYPIYTTIFLVLIPGILIFGYGIRVFERINPNQDLESYENSIWLAYITMLTIGYGDFYPVTVLGHTMVIFLLLWGGIFLALVFSTAKKRLELAKNEKFVYLEIVSSNKDREVASELSKFMFTKQHNKKTCKWHEKMLKNRPGKDTVYAKRDILFNQIVSNIKGSSLLTSDITKNLLSLNTQIEKLINS